MFSWIPLLGPIVDGIVSTVRSFFSLKSVMYRTDGSVDIEAMKTNADIIKTTADDIGIRIFRDMILFPMAVWIDLVVWDNIVLHVKPEWIWTVERFPPGLEWFPYMVFGSVFGLGAIMMYVRRR